ncbi:MAG: serine--tRNA ligase [Elusimicrobia bacterium]|nr:serine--tRNA ligase [Elusimicrobiota bacterium]
MLDINFIENNIDAVKENCRRRRCPVDVEALLALEKERVALMVKHDAVRACLNEMARSFKDVPASEEDRRKVRELKDEIAGLPDAIEQLQRKRDEHLALIPNMLDPRAPVGGDEAAVVLREVGEKPRFSFTPLSHDELGEKLNIIDIKRGVSVARARFYVLKNEAVLLRMALVRMFLSLVEGQGWELVSPPVLVKNRTLFTSGYLPFSKKDNFRIEGDDLSLIGTSEQALVGMHQDEILSSLPILYLGDSMCFRTEAGNYGRDTKGIIRVHQFFKLEQFVFCHPDESEKWHLQCLSNEEKLMQELGIPYRVVLMNSDDMAAPGALKYDTEAWLPSQNRYLEMTSNTNIRDYQCRRGQIRFKIDGKKGFPHTISATGFCDRLIVSLLEIYQQSDGTIQIPEKLRPFMNGLDRIA